MAQELPLLTFSLTGRGEVAVPGTIYWLACVYFGTICYFDFFHRILLHGSAPYRPGAELSDITRDTTKWGTV